MDIQFPNINNKLAFFDFDRTLVTHTYSKDYVKVQNYFMECVYCLTSLVEEHAKDMPLPCMQWYTKKLFDDGYGLYVLTHEIFNLRDQLKKEQLKLFYPDTPMTYLTVDTPAHKIDMITAIAMTERCDLSDIIFVDDMMSTVQMAQAAGIDAKHLSDIAALYECRVTFQQQDTFIKPKGFADLLKEDPTLIEKVAHEKTDNMNIGFSDEELEKAYIECRKIVDNEKKGDTVL